MTDETPTPHTTPHTPTHIRKAHLSHGKSGIDRVH